jgi:hypothetical protein
MTYAARTATTIDDVMSLRFISPPTARLYR